MLLAIEDHHYKKNCDELVKNINYMIDNNINKLNCQIKETYGMPFMNYQICKFYQSYNKLSSLGYKIESNKIVNNKFNLECDNEEKKIRII